MTNITSYCSLPWTHLQILPNGLVYRCCESEHKQPYGDLRKNSLLEIWSSVQVQQLRKLQSSGKWSEECFRCLNYEKSGGESLRLRENSRRGNISKAAEFPVSLDLRLDNTCNLKCRSCSPFYSTLWNKDFEALTNTLIPSLEDDLDKEKILADILQLLPKIKQITFAGGEPMLSKFHHDIIDKIAELELWDIELIYNTNLTVLPKRALSIWPKVKRVYFRASVDGIGEIGEFLRKGLNWSKFLENASIVSMIPNANVGVEYTLSVYNAFTVLETMASLLEIGFIKSSKDFVMGFVTEPTYLSAQILNDDERVRLKNHHKLVLEKLKPWLDQSSYQDFQKISDLTINFISQKQLDNERLIFSVFHNKLSSIRSEKAENLFPELRKLFF